MYHLTTSDRIESIKKEGLKSNAQDNLTTKGGQFLFNIYKNKGIYCLLENDPDNIFKSVTEYTLELDIKKENVVADLQSLVDQGAIFTEQFDYVYFKNTPLDLEAFDDEESGISVEELLTPGSDVCLASLKATGSGVYLGDIPPSRIKSIHAHSEYIQACMLGSCIHAFDEDGESLIESIRDVSDFAQLEEQSTQIEFKEFLSITRWKSSDLEKIYEDLEASSMENFSFYFNKERGVALVYNEESDVHAILKTNKIFPENREELSPTKKRMRFKI